jgi:hypothetical protein
MRKALVALAVPLAVATAAPAHASELGIETDIGGLGIRVNVINPGSLADQNCQYKAVPTQPTLLSPVFRNFTLPRDAPSVSLDFPGVPTGTEWTINISCTWAGNPPALGSPGRGTKVVRY